MPQNCPVPSERTRLHAVQRKAQREAIFILRELLGSPVPPTIEALTTEQIEDLSDALRAAKARNASEIDAAVDKGLARLPALLRGSVKRVIYR
jgi:hypothetical protein